MDKRRPPARRSLPQEERGQSSFFFLRNPPTHADILVQGNHAHGLQFDEERVPAFAMAEIAFLVSLTSVSSDVSQLAAQGLRLIAQAERQPGAPVNHGLTEEERSKRNPIYEQLGDPRIVIVGVYFLSFCRCSESNFYRRSYSRAETCEEALAPGCELLAYKYRCLGGVLLQMEGTFRVHRAESTGASSSLR